MSRKYPTRGIRVMTELMRVSRPSMTEPLVTRQQQQFLMIMSVWWPGTLKEKVTLFTIKIYIIFKVKHMVKLKLFTTQYT